MRKFSVGAVLAVSAVALWPERAEAIPEWARKYKTSCATCHEAYPRLTAFGEAFRLNGYRFPQDDEAFVRVEPVELGNRAWTKVFPNAVWPADIPGTIPLAVRVISDFNVDLGGEADARTSFNIPQAVEMLLGGTIGDSLSFFAELAFEPEYANVDATFEAEAFLNIEDIIGENWFNVRIGNIGMQEIDLPNTRGHQRLTRTAYLKNEFAIPYPTGFGEQNEFVMHTQAGLMVYGFGSWFQYAAGVVNGNGEIRDNNSEKDVFFQLAFKFGGVGFDGSGSSATEGEEIPVTPAGQWVDDSVRFGLFGYLGWADVADPLGFGDEDRFWRLGADIKGKLSDYSLAVGAVWGKNDDPYATLSDDGVDSLVWFVEAEWFAFPWLILTARYEDLSMDVPSGVLTTGQDRSRFVASATILYRANVKLIVDGVFYVENEPREDVPGGDRDDDNALVLRVDFAF